MGIVLSQQSIVLGEMPHAQERRMRYGTTHASKAEGPNTGARFTSRLQEIKQFDSANHRNSVA